MHFSNDAVSEPTTQNSRTRKTKPRTNPHHDGIHRRAQADHAQRVVLAALHLVLALLPHGPRQPFAPRVVGLGRHRGDARGLVLFPVAALAGLATVVGDLALRASAQRGAPALLAAVEAGEQVDPLDDLLLLECGGPPFLLFPPSFVGGRGDQIRSILAAPLTLAEVSRIVLGVGLFVGELSRTADVRVLRLRSHKDLQVSV